MQLRPWPRAFARLPSSPELSPAARTRLQALTVWQQTGDWRIASQVFDVSRATLYRWRRRYQPRDISSLEARSRRPHRVRRPQTPARILLRLRALRLQYPRWGREQVCILLRREGITLSAKTIDRALMRLRTSGQLVEPPGRLSPLIGGGVLAPMPAANHAILRWGSQGIASKGIRWMCAPSPVSSSNSSPPEM